MLIINKIVKCDIRIRIVKYSQAITAKTKGFMLYVCIIEIKDTRHLS